MAGMFVFYLTQPISWLIVTLDKQKYLPGIYLVGALFNVTANFILIPKFSFYGSAIITWVSELLILIMLAFAAHRAWRHKYA
jgi:O-antigen/teichoic acid export membrane protein